MKPILAGVLLLLIYQSVSLAAPPAPDCRARVDWCRPGFVCEPTSCTARSTVALERLGAQLVAARAERPRWFRPFLEGGVTWSVLEQAPGVYAEGGVILWRRLSISGQLTDEDARARIGWRREW